MATSSANSGVSVGRAAITIILGFIAAVVEGFDLQATGIARAGFAAEFMFDPAQIGWILGASTLGLAIGAIFGGRFADWLGRKPILVGAVLCYGAFSLLSTQATDYYTLWAARFLTGVGLGGAIPNLIALTSEAAGPRFRSIAVSMMYCGMPLGSAGTALYGNAIEAGMWRDIFYFGGIAPVIMVPLLALLLPESLHFIDKKKAMGNASSHSGLWVGFFLLSLALILGVSWLPTKPHDWIDGEQITQFSIVFNFLSLPLIMITGFIADKGSSRALFGSGRLTATTMLWICYFFSLLTLYLLISWLPAFAQTKGLTREDANIVSAIFNIAGLFAMPFFGYLMDRISRRLVLCIIYAGIVLSLGGLSVSNGFVAIATTSFLVNFFNSGSQIALYALTPLYYPALNRGTGIGSAMSCGRYGSFVGPVAAGYVQALLAWGPDQVVIAAIPGIILSFFCIQILIGRPQSQD